MKVMILLKEPMLGHKAIVGEFSGGSLRTNATTSRYITLCDAELWCPSNIDQEVRPGEDWYAGYFGFIDSKMDFVEIPEDQIRACIHDEKLIEKLRNYDPHE